MNDYINNFGIIVNITFWEMKVGMVTLDFLSVAQSLLEPCTFELRLQCSLEPMTV